MKARVIIIFLVSCLSNGFYFVKSFRFSKLPAPSQLPPLNSHQELSPVTNDNISHSTDKKSYNLIPCGDELDKRIFSLALPAMLNLAIIPLVGAVDTFFVGKMNNVMALAGQGAANQIFSSSFWLFSFLPLVTTPLVAAAAGANNNEAVQERVTEAMFLGTIVGIIGTILLGTFSGRALSLVLVPGAPARMFAEPYLSIRAITFIPALLSTVGFAAFRGKMDVTVPLKISLISNLVNIILDPILIFTAGMGVSGAAAATCVAECVGFVLYMRKLIQLKMINVSKLIMAPKWKTLKPLLLGGFSVQLRSIAIEIAYLALSRATNIKDSTGISAAAHSVSMQIWLLAGVVLFSMSTVSSILVPNEIAQGKGDLTSAKAAANRLLVWGAILGVIFSIIQLAALPLVGIFSPLKEVQDAARIPTMIGAALQLINGIVFVGEGIQQGNQSFGSLAFSTIVATACMLASLALFGKTLTGVWCSLSVFFLFRLAGVLRHHFLNGPFAKNGKQKYLKLYEQNAQ